MEEVKSPCIKICRMDENGVCFGCRRNRYEVGNWSKFTNKEKLEIIDKTMTRTNTEDTFTGFMR
ncbi:MAG: DUF1289 domain-containing protein [Salinivirgaceae bacterium]|nr:DUF1289 domain-containing protein [Salinivirgaceae bacterium]